jgi:flavorubredoxin
MHTTVSEVGDRIFRFSTCIPEIAPGGFTFNQFLIDGDEPLLFHTGMRALFPLVSEAMKTVMPLERLRWISFGHVEADECGATNDWLAAAPLARVAHSTLACDVSVRDLCARPPLSLEDGGVLEAGNRRFTLIQTPHVPHNWEAIVLFEERTRTLLCGDILSTTGDHEPLKSSDPVDAVLNAERMFKAWSLSPGTIGVLHRLAALQPTTLLSMHGSSFEGNGRNVLETLAHGLAVVAAERARA